MKRHFIGRVYCHCFVEIDFVNRLQLKLDLVKCKLWQLNKTFWFLSSILEGKLNLNCCNDYDSKDILKPESHTRNSSVLSGGDKSESRERAEGFRFKVTQGRGWYSVIDFFYPLTYEIVKLYCSYFKLSRGAAGNKSSSCI